MNGSLYISFFQGQLESTMEQVVQLAVQEITKTVGASLNSLLLETTAKDQENQRLRLRLQSSKFDSGEAGNACGHGEGMEEDPTSEDLKIPVHAANLSSQLAMHISSYRLEQRGQAVGKLSRKLVSFLFFGLNPFPVSYFDVIFILYFVTGMSGCFPMLCAVKSVGKKRLRDVREFAGHERCSISVLRCSLKCYVLKISVHYVLKFHHFRFWK